MVRLTKMKYQEIQKYSHAEMEKYLNDIYETGLADAELNYDILANKLKEVKGVTISKMQEIVKCIKQTYIIQKNLRKE